MRRFVLLIALVLLAGPAAAQSIDWTPRDDLNATLPPGITVYEGADDFLTLEAWYVRADLSAAEGWTLRAVLSDDADGLEPVSDIAQEAEAYVAVNAGYFGGGVSYSLVAEEGLVRSKNLSAVSRSAGTYYPVRGTFGRLQDGTLDVAWVYDVDGTTYAYPAPSPNTQTDPAPQPSATYPEGGAPWPLDTAVGGGPVLVEDGERRITWEEEVFFDSGIGTPGTRNPRTAVGYTAEGEVLLLVVDGRRSGSVGATLYELADIMIALGAVEAVNLDGGGSSTMVVGETVLNEPSDGQERAVASALLLAPPSGDTGGGLGEAVFDTGDACCYAETGAWFETANDGFYGTTRSRLNEVGTGEDRAVFRFEGIEVGRYEVAAWWVPAGNRATNTPFRIYQDGAPSLVLVDQSAGGALGQWNALGTFDLSPGDSLVVTDDATGPTTPAYVAVDALRLTLVSRVGVETPEGAGDGAGLQLYPNPARGHVTLRLPRGAAEGGTGVVMDVLGRVVQRFALPAANAGQPLRVALPAAAGLYLVRVTTPQVVYQRPLIVR